MSSDGSTARGVAWRPPRRQARRRMCARPPRPRAPHAHGGARPEGELAPGRRARYAVRMAPRPYLALPAPWIVAHRGGSRLAPENTLPAFERAAALGADALEIDVRLTEDGTV